MVFTKIRSLQKRSAGFSFHQENKILQAGEMNIVYIILFFLFLAAGIFCSHYRVFVIGISADQQLEIETLPLMIISFTTAAITLVLIFRHNAKRVRKQREMVNEIGKKF